MFKCDICHQPQPAGTSIQHRAIEIRPVKYNHLLTQGNRMIYTSNGWEIVSEAKVCPQCATSDKVPTLESLLEAARHIEPVEKRHFLSKRPKSRKTVPDRDRKMRQRVRPLKIAREEWTPRKSKNN